jgi:hypothetical protein
MEITMVMSGDHLLMIEHIISMEYIVIILYRYYYNIGGFTAKADSQLEFHLDFQQQI